MLKIIIERDGDGYLAKVEGKDNLFAFGHSKQEAKDELLNVVEMMMDFQLEQIEEEKIVKKNLLSNKVIDYAL